MRLLSLGAVLVPLLPVEGTGVITPAGGRVMATGSGGNTGWSDGSLPPQSLCLCPQTCKVTKNMEPPRSFGEVRPRSESYMNTPLD